MKEESKCRHCADCDRVMLPGDGIEVESDIVKHGQHKTETITVCRECYKTLYKEDYMSELYFYEFGMMEIDKPIQL